MGNPPVQPHSLWFHVDLDAFFAAVEEHDDPALRRRPVVVGAKPGGRGVVSTCSYAARAFGIHSAMPINQAYARCPHAVFLPVRMARYAAVSQQIMAIFAATAPTVQQISIDEAFLDFTGTERLLGAPPVVAQGLKQRIADALGLTVSIGVAGSRYVAKLASAFRKPDGLTIVAPGHEAGFVQSLPLEALWGIGAQTRRRLVDVGMTTPRAIAACAPGDLIAALGAATGRFVHLAVHGNDPGIYTGTPKQRSISAERTFQADIVATPPLHRCLLDLASEITHRLHAAGEQTTTLVIKIRYHDFTTVTARSSRATEFVDVDDVYAHAKSLLAAKVMPGKPLRLLGLACLVGSPVPAPAGEQLSLFDAATLDAGDPTAPDERTKRRALDSVVTDLNRRFPRKLVKAELIRRDD